MYEETTSNTLPMEQLVELVIIVVGDTRVHKKK